MEVRKPTRTLRLPEVIYRTSLKKSTIYEFIANGSFPKPINLGSRAVGWLEEEIDQWLDKKIQQSRNPVQI